MRKQLINVIRQQGFDHSSTIRINREMAAHLAHKWKSEPFLLPTWDSPIGMDNNVELASRYFFFGNLLNFSFSVDNEHIGPVGDIRFWLKLRSHPEILQISNLINLSHTHFQSIFGSLSYSYERVKIWRESAQVLRRMYNSKVSELFEANHWNGPQIISALAKNFPSLQDSPQGLPFLRRAVLILFMVHARFQESNLFSQLEYLPVAADSQTFNGLLQLGVLEIDSELLEALLAGLTSEQIVLSLRSLTVLAAETLLEELNLVRKSKIETYHLDYMLRKHGKAPVSLGQNYAF